MFELKPYHSNPEYIEYLEKCHEICNIIYIARNISLREDVILEQLRKIDKLLANKDKFQ